MDSLHHLIYQSSVLAPLSAGALQRLLGQARAQNLQAGITGVLLYDGSRFLEVLEGPAAAVAAAFARIRADCRHTDVHVLADGRITARQFASWTMGLVGSAGPLRAAHPDMPASLQALTDVGLWLLIREFRAGAGRLGRLGR